MKVPKAYYIDIDGTLTSSHNGKDLNYLDVRAIKAAARDGAFIILATGRTPDKTYPVFDQININKEQTSIIACNNGSVIIDARTREVIKEDYMSKEDFEGVFNFLYNKGFIIKNSENDKYYGKNNLRSKIVKRFTMVDHTLDDFFYNNVSARKLGCISTFSKSYVRKLAKIVREKFPGVEVAISGPSLYLEITKKGCDKGNAIKYISKLIKVNPEDSVHIGDSMNDLPAFNVVGTSVALSNGMKDLKKEADFISKSQKENGVAEAINSLRQKKNK